jgi:predicted RNA methylase
MNMQSSTYQELQLIVQTLLNPDANPGELLNAARNLSEFFEQFSSVSTHDTHFESKDSTHTYLKSGIAISPLDAAICTNEYMRTAKYLRGIYAAIQDLHKEFGKEPINILYAGCGPYGTLIVPLLHLLDLKRINVTFLDIHQTSLDSVKNILSGLDLDVFSKDQVKYVQADATQYQVTEKPHLIITETMKAAFENEPQVSITLNLLPQMHKKGIFIPGRVVVCLEAQSSTVEENNGVLNKIQHKIPLCDIIDLDTTQTLKTITKENLICTKEYEFQKDFEVHHDLFYTTTITVYKDVLLGENECSLNIPQKLDLYKKPIKGDYLYFSYQFEGKPKILCKFKDEDFKGWIPQKVMYKDHQEQIVWYHMDGIRFTNPFFDDSFSLSSPKRQSSWEELQTVAKEIRSAGKAIEPSGFIFHTSRCGSTLVSQALALFEENIVLSEAQLIHEALSVDYNIELSSKEKLELLKDVITLLGQKRFPYEKRLFIKFDAWSIAELDLIQEAYPDVPWIFLYRDPIEILVSQNRKRGFFTVPGVLKGKLLNEVPKETHFNDYHKIMIEKIFETAVEKIQQYQDDKKCMVINYEQLHQNLLFKVFKLFGMDLSPENQQLIEQRLKFSSKKPQASFQNDTVQKQQEASDDLKVYVEKNIQNYYKALKSQIPTQEVNQNI